MNVAGIDIGSITTEAVILQDGRTRSSRIIPTGANSRKAAERCLSLALEGAGLGREDLAGIVATGYGRASFPGASKTITEITCHARGVFSLHPPTRTVIDIGGQDSKVIRLDARGRNVDFQMNDKCAAGTGRGMEVFAELLGIPIEEVGERSFQVREDPPAVSNTCVVYAKSEALGLIREGRNTEEVLAAYCRATAERIHSLVERIGVAPEFGITGGMAKNRGVVDRLMSMIGLEAAGAGWDPQIAGALGAALFGQALCRRGKGRKK